MTYDELNTIVLATSEMIEDKSGAELSNMDKCALNDKITEFLQDMDIEVTD